MLGSRAAFAHALFRAAR